MMTLRIGTKQTKGNRPPQPCAFTLLELILVMAIMLIVLAVSAPSLSGFFKGRTLDAEARRVLALTRHGQSRAVSEGAPMLLWFDKEARTYGLREDSTYGEQARETKETVFDLGQELEVELEYVQMTRRVDARSSSGGGLDSGMLSSGGARAAPGIRFLPTGFIAEGSPESIWIREGTRGSVWITRSRNRLNYEIQTNKLQYPSR